MIVTLSGTTESNIPGLEYRPLRHKPLPCSDRDAARTGNGSGERKALAQERPPKGGLPHQSANGLVVIVIVRLLFRHLEAGDLDEIVGIAVAASAVAGGIGGEVSQ